MIVDLMIYQNLVYHLIINILITFLLFIFFHSVLNIYATKGGRKVSSETMKTIIYFYAITVKVKTYKLCLYSINIIIDRITILCMNFDIFSCLYYFTKILLIKTSLLYSFYWNFWVHIRYNFTVYRRKEMKRG